jgi:hypothetical protein
MLRALCLLLLSYPVCGQISSSSIADEAAPVAAPISITAADTVVALHRLFINRRVGGVTLLGASVLPLVGVPAISVENSEPGGYKPLAAFMGGALLGIVITAPIAYLGGHQLSWFSKKREAQIIAEYQEKHVLPLKIRRKLRSGLFLPAELYAPKH